MVMQRMATITRKTWWWWSWLPSLSRNYILSTFRNWQISKPQDIETESCHFSNHLCMEPTNLLPPFDEVSLIVWYGWPTLPPIMLQWKKIRWKRKQCLGCQTHCPLNQDCWGWRKSNVETPSFFFSLGLRLLLWDTRLTLSPWRETGWTVLGYVGYSFNSGDLGCLITLLKFERSATTRHS